MTHFSSNLKAVTDHISTPAPRTVAMLITMVNNDSSLTKTQRRCETSALKRLCDILGKTPNDVPLVPTEFRALIDRLHVEQAPKRHLHFENVSPGALGNIKSLCKRAYRRYAEQLRTSRPPMSTAWAALLCLCKNERQGYDLRRFARFATGRGVEPDSVTDAVAEAFRKALDADPFAQDPPAICRRTLLAWNRGVRECPGWPARNLALTRAKEGYCLSWREIEAISPAFRCDVEAFGNYLGRKNGLMAKGPRRALRPKSIKHRTFQLQQAFSIWHRHSSEGALVKSVGDLAQPSRAAVVLEFFLKRKNGEATSQSDGMLNLLLSIARHYAQLGDDVVEELHSYRGMVGYTQIGLTKKVRAMLRQFDSERNLGLLIHLPGRVYRKIRAKRRISLEDALEMRRAVMVELGLVTGMRRGVHSRLRSDVHLQRYRDAKGGHLFLDIEGRETKNHDAEGYPLPDPTVEMLLFYLEKCRPILDPAATGWFYPGEVPGQPLCEDQVSREIAGAVFGETGLKLTAHAFRHLIGMIHLREHPGELEVLRRFYNHRGIDVTVNNYAGFNQAAAVKRVDSVILALREAIPDPKAD